MKLADLQEKLTKTGKLLEGEECYAIFQKMGLEYGPAFQGLQRVFMGPNEVLAKIKLPDMVVREERFGLHPTLLDAIIQAARVMDSAIIKGKQQNTLMPSSLESLEIMGSPRGYSVGLGSPFQKW